MTLTARQLNRTTLARQLLLARETISAVEAVRRVVALQAQEAPSPYLALWNRVTDFDPVELDVAFTKGDVVKASLMRITLHAVHLADYPMFHAAMAPTLRASRLNDRRFTSTGLSTVEVDQLIPELLKFTREPRTSAQVKEFFAEIGKGHERIWWALRTYAPLIHAPTGGPWLFGFRPSFQAATAESPTDVPVPWLVRRYLEAFGPATVADISQFTLLTRTVVRDALMTLGDALIRRKGPEGAQLYDVPDGLVAEPDTPVPPRLLPMWDSVLLAYHDRSRVIPPEYRSLVIKRNGDVLPTLLVDGYVAGVWRPVDGGIEAIAFHRLSDEVWEAVATEARALSGLLAGRDPRVYQRYGHWWRSLSGAEVRVLPGSAAPPDHPVGMPRSFT